MRSSYHAMPHVMFAVSKGPDATKLSACMQLWLDGGKISGLQQQLGCIADCGAVNGRQGGFTLVAHERRAVADGILQAADLLQHGR